MPNKNIEMTNRIVFSLERIATAIEQFAQCQKDSVLRSEAMQMASMDGSPTYERYLLIIKNASSS